MLKAHRNVTHLAAWTDGQGQDQEWHYTSARCPALSEVWDLVLALATNASPWLVYACMLPQLSPSC